MGLGEYTLRSAQQDFQSSLIFPQNRTEDGLNRHMGCIFIQKHSNTVIHGLIDFHERVIRTGVTSAKIQKWNVTSPAEDYVVSLEMVQALVRHLV